MKKIAFWCCDVQEAFKNIIPNYEQCVYVAKRMALASDVLGLPYVITEQNSSKLGKSDPRISEETKRNPIEKMTFSMYPVAKQTIESYDAVALFGFESHVCVLQTAEDLINNGKTCYLLLDGIGSRHTLDTKMAIKQLVKKGIELTTSESLLFQLLVSAEHPKFKDILKIVKSSDTNVHQ